MGFGLASDAQLSTGCSTVSRGRADDVDDPGAACFPRNDPHHGLEHLSTTINAVKGCRVPVKMLSGPPRIIPLVSLFVAVCLVWWYLHTVPGAGSSIPTWKSGASANQHRPSLRGDPLDFGLPLRFSDGQKKPPGSNYTFKIVVPKTQKEDISWMAAEIPDAPLVVYEVDNPNAEHKIPKNKGREAMVRLHLWHIDGHTLTHPPGLSLLHHRPL